MKTKKQQKKSQVYDYTDKIIRRINAMTVVQLTDLPLTDFDELNVLDNVNQAYKMVDIFARAEYMKLFKDSYEKAAKVAKADDPRSVDDEQVVVDILSKPNPVTRYIYSSEYERKRTRCYESLMSAKEKEVRKMLIMTAINVLCRQTKEFCNYITYMAMIKAYRDAGVLKVKWVALEDDKICEECADLDGTVHPIDNVPIKPHINCRCWLVPVVDK